MACGQGLWARVDTTISDGGGAGDSCMRPGNKSLNYRGEDAVSAAYGFCLDTLQVERR